MDRLEIRKQLKAEREEARIKDENPMVNMCNKIKTELIAECDADFIFWTLNKLEGGNEKISKETNSDRSNKMDRQYR